MARSFKSNRSDGPCRFRYRGLYAELFSGKLRFMKRQHPDKSNGDQFMADLIRLRKTGRRNAVSFYKKELGQLLGLYSSRVISGEWRDYSIDHSDDGAAFSIFVIAMSFRCSRCQNQRKGQRQPTLS